MREHDEPHHFEPHHLDPHHLDPHSGSDGRSGARRRRTLRHRSAAGARRGVAAGGLAVAALVFGACGSDDGDLADGARPSDDPVAGPIDVTAVDYSFVGVPIAAKAGATLTLRNDSTKEVHEVVAVRLPDDEARSVADIVRLPPEELAAFFPGVATVLVAPPGEDGFAVEGTGALTEPGRYALICVIPTGADPVEYLTAAAESEGGPPEVAGGPPHIAEGMFAELVVVD